MLTGIPLLLLIACSILFIVVMGSTFKINPFVVLLLAALLTGIFSGIPIGDIANAANEGFGNMMKKIGLVVILGTLIGTVLEKSGSILRIANFILQLFGEGRSVAAITVIGVVVGIPIFCDSGYIILSGLTQPLAKKSGQRHAAIVCGLASGLYITHTLLPPHPGSIAGAANLGLKEHLGTVIGIGLLMSIPLAIVAWWFSSRIAAKVETTEEETLETITTGDASLGRSFLPILVPLLLIAISSFSFFLEMPVAMRMTIDFLGHPVIALLIGFGLSLTTVASADRSSVQGWIKEGILHAGSILVIVGAGGVFGEVLKKTSIADLVTGFTSGSDGSVLFFLFIAWCMGVLLKTAQGSTTSAIIVVTSIIAPLAAAAGLDTPTELSLLLASIAGGTMMISHTNDAYFWVISQFSGMGMSSTYKTFSIATLFMSIAALITVLLLALIML
ncbi:MAG: GntP family permease [Chitinophagia bacterium]|nr:GntP family permease [Chitinophagia bacterium]